jgi:Tfp pilus assembly protein PilN
VNLLQSAIARPGRTRRSLGDRAVAVAGPAIAVVALCAVAPWWWTLHREAAHVDGELARARQRTARLRPRAAQADALVRTAAALQQRIEAVERLQRARGEHLRVLTAVSEALPDDCWLSTLADDGSGAVRIEGRALDVSSVVELVRGIAASGVFAGGVEVVDSHITTAATAGGDAVAFVLRALRAAPPAPSGRTPARPPQPAPRVPR